MPTPLLDRFLAFLDDSPSPQHAAANVAEALAQVGFSAIDERAKPESLKAGAKHYIQRNGSIVAFRIGSGPVAEVGFRLIAAHTDSPNLRIKPNPEMKKHGMVRLGVETYGGVLQASWADRDLGIAGQVVLRDGSLRLVDLRRPLCRIPNLAIHLNRGVNKDGLVLNAQTQLPALLTLSDEERPLHRLLAAELGCDADDILTWDLGLYDLTPPTLAGAHDEFLHSARLDNLASCHAGLEAMVAACEGDAPSQTAVLGLFDHEEIGSRTARGAQGRMFEDVLSRIVRDSPQAEGGLARAMAHSWLISADMAHAVHPGFSEKHDGEHMPKLGKGPVIKRNANWRYGTEADSAAMFIALCQEVDAPYQYFVNRSDLSCGSTVGPIVASNLGVRTVDCGNPMLSMHSAREMCASADHEPMTKVMTAFFQGAGPA
ncbi:MAG: M18 family aminopeptidase [Proteobacteria bacterium]|nr:M18 family aminopeptidase [Pseudomonadota bacterium]